MIARRPRPLCAICADREATTITDWECDSGAVRTVLACWPCLSPVPGPLEEYEPVDLFDDTQVSARACDPTDHTTRDALLDVIGKLGAPTFAEVLAEMGVRADVASNARAAVRRKLSMLVQVGAVSFAPHDPANPRAGGRYTATGRPPIAADLIERFKRAPDTFATADLGLPPGRAAAGAIRSLIAAGLVESAGRAAVWRKTSTARRAA